MTYFLEVVQNVPTYLLSSHYFQDYDTFFTAVECEALFRYLDLQPPPDEVEAQLQDGVLDILQPKEGEVTEHIAHLEPTKVSEQIARHKPTETAL